MSDLMKLLFVFACLALSAVQGSFVYTAGATFDATANVTLPAVDPRFNYRHHTSAVTLGVFTDISVQSQADANGANTNGVISCAYSILNYPTYFMAFYNNSASASFGSNVIQTDISSSSSYIAQVFEKIEEVDIHGTVVATIDLSTGLTWAINNGLQTADALRGLVSASFTASKSGATFAFTATASAVLGKLNNGDAIITPTTLVSYFEVNAYVYANVTNHLRLTVYVAQLSASASVATSSKVTAGEGAGQIYANFESTVQVNGSPQAVTVSGLTDNQISVNKIPSSIVRTQISGSATLTPEVRKVTVDYPQGTSSFTSYNEAGFSDPNFKASDATSDGVSVFGMISKATLFIVALVLAFSV